MYEVDGECACENNQSQVMHIERFDVHRILSINSMYSRSYSQYQHVKKSHILGHDTGW